tara:strand:+ start:266 stop:616 length:351 start_codon:yes stop_codon:yes gene_type:complete
MEKAKCVITDISNISFEYMLLFNRPVLYLEGINKIHNKNYSEFDNFESIENKLKRKFGFSFLKNDIGKIDTLVRDAIADFNPKIPEVNRFKEKYFYNYGKTIDEFKKIWENEIIKD